MTKWVYSFNDKKAEGSAQDTLLLGGKGANLAEMSRLGIPVPPGFTITTQVCTHYYHNNRQFPAGLREQVYEKLGELEDYLCRRLGDTEIPLLLSIRSGAAQSMPGMMDTVLNLGLNDETVKGLAKLSQDERFAYDCYRRFIQMYGNVVLDIDHDLFENTLREVKSNLNCVHDNDLGIGDLQQLIALYQKKIIAKLEGARCPQDVHDQLWNAIGAVFDSWMNPRAMTYRRLHDIPHDLGTAVTIQAMVFGNMGEHSATGVAFSRNPSTGVKECFGEYLPNAQGEDIVSGIRTPLPLFLSSEKHQSLGPSMIERMPSLVQQLIKAMDQLEHHYKDMQDVEFTVQQGKLWVLQTRNGKRSASAALKIAVDMVKEGLISKEEALMRLPAKNLEQLLHPRLDPSYAHAQALTKGLPAAPGAASGRVVFKAKRVEKLAAKGEPVILARIETNPDDIHGMIAAKGILTACGGMTSHAAVVARGMGRPCVVAATALVIDYDERTMRIGETLIKEGDFITIDGSTGRVMKGSVPMIEPTFSEEFKEIMAWADDVRRMRVYANAETLKEAQIAQEFGAEGIGLCRTEHMFFEPDRILCVREMIMANDGEGRRAALAKIQPMQQEDFVKLFEVMAGKPVVIRLLDPPLHEFLPSTEHDINQLAEVLNVSSSHIRQRIRDMHEVNPMLGHRGCRLGITYPEIYEMQAHAIFEAASQVSKAQAIMPDIEIMVPLVAYKRELDIIKAQIDKGAEKISKAYETFFKYRVGTMIELPRAALAAGDIAQTAEFFSFGTNDLTQTTLGLSRDDTAPIILEYQAQGIMETDPFLTLDVSGVGLLIRQAIEAARTTNAYIKLGICGEHGGDPDSIRFFERVGIDYVSCSPYRIPVARLAAAQATITAKDERERGRERPLIKLVS